MVLSNAVMLIPGRGRLCQEEHKAQVVVAEEAAEEEVEVEEEEEACFRSPLIHSNKMSDIEIERRNSHNKSL